MADEKKQPWFFRKLWESVLNTVTLGPRALLATTTCAGQLLRNFLATDVNGGQSLKYKQAVKNRWKKLTYALSAPVTAFKPKRKEKRKPLDKVPGPKERSQDMIRADYVGRASLRWAKYLPQLGIDSSLLASEWVESLFYRDKKSPMYTGPWPTIKQKIKNVAKSIIMPLEPAYRRSQNKLWLFGGKKKKSEEKKEEKKDEKKDEKKWGKVEENKGKTEEKNEGKDKKADSSSTAAVPVVGSTASSSNDKPKDDKSKEKEDNKGKEKEDNKWKENADNKSKEKTDKKNTKENSWEKEKKPSKVQEVDKMTPELLQKNPDKVFLFGDNLAGTGKGGQAIIRDEPNAIGIPIKKKPDMTDDSFFTDKEFEENKKAIDQAFDKIPENTIVVLPKNGLWTGFAKLPEKAPKTLDYLKYKISQLGKPKAEVKSSTYDKQYKRSGKTIDEIQENDRANAKAKDRAEEEGKLFENKDREEQQKLRKSYAKTLNNNLTEEWLVARGKEKGIWDTVEEIMENVKKVDVTFHSFLESEVLDKAA